jgi:hypothetical protein
MTDPRQKKRWWQRDSIHIPQFSFSDLIMFDLLSEVIGDLIEGIVVIVAEIVEGIW